VKVEGGAGLVEKVPFVGEVWVNLMHLSPLDRNAQEKLL